MKEDQRIVLTRRLLKEGLLRLMENKPIEKIGVSELCAESGINRSTFYRYYELPKDLLLEIEREIVEDLHYETWEIKNRKDVIRCTETLLGYMEKNAAALRILMNNHSDEYLTRMLDQFCNLVIHSKLRIAIGNELDEESIRLCSAYTLGGIYFLMREWLVKEIPKTAQEVSALVLHCMDASARLYNLS